VSFFNGIITYIILAQYLGLGSIIETGYFAKYLVGNSFYLKDFSNNSKLFNLELYFGKGAQFIRSAGTFGIFLGFLNQFKIIIKLPSKKIYFISYFCIATLGQVFYIFKKYKNIKKAGSSRRKGIRPSVRGVAMNPVDHPHGGGEGKSSGGRPSVSP
jgi:large subunit ribosomal protein L2